MGSNKKRKNVQAKMTVDAVAAAVILKNIWIDRSKRPGNPERTREDIQ